ncbi:unnamed protein product [Linum tenue]|uniref:LOB domain-containing protein n=1 Tax=Linum tenue TaxID=586396 RepID=A0AAV0R900_9ROSI|nr:unnamed protein product [Linum tenue]
MSHSQQPCAACKLQRRKCTQECIFAPHFPPDQPQKFANIHKVFGASNVAKLLSELPATHREEAVNSLAYEADARLKDPVYGCLGQISILQHRLKQLHMDLDAAKQELVKYMGPQAHHFPALIPNTTTNNNSAFQQNNNNNMIHMVGIPAAHHHHQQQQQEMFRAYEQNQQRHHHHINHDQEVIGFGSGVISEDHHHHHHVGNNSIHDGFDNEISGVGGDVEPCLALGSMDHHHQSQVEIPAQEQLFFQLEQQEQPDANNNYHHQQQSPGSDEGRSLGPSLC